MTRNSPVPKGAIIDYLMETDQFKKRESCLRVVDRHLSEMQSEGLVSTDNHGMISINRKLRLVVGQPFGAWLALGVGVAIFFIGMAATQENTLSTIVALAFFVYSVGVTLRYISKFSPY